MAVEPVVIDWCALETSEREFVGRSLSELHERLAVQYPEFPRVELRELSDVDRERVGGYLARKIVGTSELAHDPFDSRKLFVFCSASHEVAHAIRQENPMAQWGGAQQGEWAVAWEKDNPFVIWHEAMHVLFAEDCYDASGCTTCREPHCLMQYEPTAENCAGTMVLCETNVSRVVRLNVRAGVDWW
ncbi:MAG: hypothetical protein WBC44_09835 [Planctomycetaceae bacterium]